MAAVCSELCEPADDWQSLSPGITPPMPGFEPASFCGSVARTASQAQRVRVDAKTNRGVFRLPARPARPALYTTPLPGAAQQKKGGAIRPCRFRELASRLRPRLPSRRLPIAARLAGNWIGFRTLWLWLWTDFYDGASMRRGFPSMRRSSPSMRETFPSMRESFPSMRRAAASTRRSSPFMRESFASTRRSAPSMRRYAASTFPEAG